MNTKSKSILFYLLTLGLIFSLFPLTACSFSADAAAENTVPATPILTQPVTEAPSEKATEVPPVEPARKEQYINATYQLAFEIPPDWTLSEYPVGQGVSGYAPSQAVELTMGDYRLLVHIKYAWDPTIIGGGLGPGEVVKDGAALLLSQPVSRNQLVHEGFTKLVWYGLRSTDLELYIRLENISGKDWAEIDISNEMISETEAILASFVRTGTPLTPPADLTLLPLLEPTSVPLAASQARASGQEGFIRPVTTRCSPPIDS